MKKATAILTADIELRSFQPTCRTDDHWQAQEKKIKWLKRLAKRHECPILDAGDLFDKKYKSHPSHELLCWAIENLPTPFYTIPGNHDLPGKSIENYSNSAMAVLEKAQVVIVPKKITQLLWIEQSPYVHLYSYPWGVDFKEEQPEKGYFNIALVHAMVYEEFEPFPGCVGYSAKELMSLLPDFDLIVSGHNHQTFVREEKGRILVNPGSLMRNDADQIDHKPCVFLWYSEDNTIEQIFVPIEEGVISRDHIDVKKEKDNRLDAFVEKLGEQIITGINFHENLVAAVADEAVPAGVENKVWKYFEGIK